MKKIYSGIKVLIAEDSQTQAQTLSYLLENHNMHVITCPNGKIALDKLQNGDDQPDIVVTDIMMPEMDGYELCRSIKNDPQLKTIPVILLTELSNSEDVIRGLEAGADNFIIKPYDENFLLSRIEYIIVNQKIRQNTKTDFGMEIVFNGKKYFITSSKMQIVDLLLATYETAVRQNKELIERNKQLEKSLEEVKQLKGMIPICSHCKKIRDDNGFWEQVEVYIASHTGADFSHSLCPSCMAELYPEYYQKMNPNKENEK